jgi:hypothetical protein
MPEHVYCMQAHQVAHSPSHPVPLRAPYCTSDQDTIAAALHKVRAPATHNRDWCSSKSSKGVLFCAMRQADNLTNNEPESAPFDLSDREAYQDTFYYAE